MRTLERAWRAGRSEWRAHATSALGISVAFLCLAFALISDVNLRELAERWEHPGRISVYLSSAATEEQVRELSTALRGTPGVESAAFVASEQTRDELLASSGDPLLGALPGDVFPPTIEVTLTPLGARQRGQTIAASLSRLPAVDSVETYSGWARRVGELVRAAGVVVWALVVVVFLSVVTVVASTTKLALERRREEVEVLRFVGATSQYVRGPFLIEGATQGAAGALVALVLSAATFTLLRRTFAHEFQLLLGVEPVFLPWVHSSGLVVVGALLGAFAAHLTLRRVIAS